MAGIAFNEHPIMRGIGFALLSTVALTGGQLAADDVRSINGFGPPLALVFEAGPLVVAVLVLVVRHWNRTVWAAGALLSLLIGGALGLQCTYGSPGSNAPLRRWSDVDLRWSLAFSGLSMLVTAIALYVPGPAAPVLPPRSGQ